MQNKARLLRATLCASALAVTGSFAYAQESINIYSARHYKSDEALYAAFTKATGIRIQRVDADDAGILNRLKSEGAASPADVVLLVDAARLWKADQEGLFAPVQSKLLDKAIPEKYRAKASPKGTTWFGFSSRARIVVYDKSQVKREDVDTYEELAEAKNQGKLCTRSGSHPYNLSLFAAMLERLGEQKTQNWLQGLVRNQARAPKGGDTDQIKAVASGECQIAITNSYYLARLLRSNKPEDVALAERVGVVFPNQNGVGTHVNIAGGAVARHAKNPAAAVKFLEFLASTQAQTHFANGNNEWPTANGMTISNSALHAMTGGKGWIAEGTRLEKIGANQTRVQMLLDRVGYP